MQTNSDDARHGAPRPAGAAPTREDHSPGGAGTAERAAAAALLRAPGAEALGRTARSPIEISWPGWRVVLRRALREMLTDRMSLVAAGCAFYGTLALFPAMTMLIALYGLVFDPVTVVPQLAVLRDFLPPAAYQLIAQRLEELVRNPPGALTFQLVVSILVALWSAAAAIKSVIAALNLAYREQERRGFIRYNVVAFAITLCAIVGTVAGLAVLVGLPALLHLLGVQAAQRHLLRLAGFAMLVVAVMGGLSLLYRYGPSRAPAKWRWVTAGSVVATVIWLAASALFSFYVANFATYDAMYGPLGTVVGVMMWFYVTAYAVLLGAELNAGLELQTLRDSTDGMPRRLGRRGAYVADHVTEGP